MASMKRSLSIYSKEFRERCIRSHNLHKTFTCVSCGNYWSDKKVESLTILKHEFKFNCPHCNNVVKVKKNALSEIVNDVIFNVSSFNEE